jgi:cytochrome P450
MKAFNIFDRQDGWASASEAFRDDFATGCRVQAAPWGGLAILGHGELLALARNPFADGMAPDASAMAETPRLYRLLSRALFTKSGPAHRAERAASIKAFNTVPLAEIIRIAVKRVAPTGPTEIDLRSGLIAPITLSVWGAIVGYDANAIARLGAALVDLGYLLSPRPDPTKAHLADQAAEEIRGLSLAALETGTPFARSLRALVGDEPAADLIAGMAFDAVDTATVGIDAALRVAAANREHVKPATQYANECLRLASSTPMTMRLTTGEIDLGDLTIEAGTVLSMIWAAGNHDPLVFPQPEKFDPNRGPARALMFGMGQHSCLGHAIVRATLLQLLTLFEERGPVFEGDLGGWNPLGHGYLPSLTVRL